MPNRQLIMPVGHNELHLKTTNFRSCKGNYVPLVYVVNLRPLVSNARYYKAITWTESKAKLAVNLQKKSSNGSNIIITLIEREIAKV